MKPEDFRADAKRPLTGEEYLKSLQDGREIYIYGERVKDVTTHPAFRNAAASVAQLYDALHKPEMQDSLCCTLIPAAAATPTNSSAWRKAPTICASSATPSPNGRA